MKLVMSFLPIGSTMLACCDLSTFFLLLSPGLGKLVSCFDLGRLGLRLDLPDGMSSFQMMSLLTCSNLMMS